VQTAIQEQKLIAYESTILTALEEVENALTAFVNEQDRNNNLQEAAEASKTAVELVQQKYETGLVDFSDVLDAQRSLLSFQNELVQSNGVVSSNFIRLYKALGGGWKSFVSEDEKNKSTGERNGR
jgi:outer membrane protein TolC